MVIINYLSTNKEWIFSGIGVLVLTAIGAIVKMILNKNKKTEEHVMSDNTLVGNNIIGNNNVINLKTPEQKEKLEKSWFSNRFSKLQKLLNEASGGTEEEFTIEYISSIIGLDDVNELKKYLFQDCEPNDDFKERFVKAFGVNREWMLHNKGNYPFKTNVQMLDNDAMDILLESDLKNILKFIVVIGMDEGKRYACIIRKTSEYCYELYPKKYYLFSDVGGAGKRKLVNFYRFLKESDRINKLDGVVYYADADKFKKLYMGEIAPFMVERFKPIPSFTDVFLDLKCEFGYSDSCVWDEDLIKVQEKIRTDIEHSEKINQQEDRKRIQQNLGIVDYAQSQEEPANSDNDIDGFSDSTPFFDYRFGKAFPGVRGVKEFTNSKECIDRLAILLRKPLSKNGLSGPIWWFRGNSNLSINRFVRLSDDKFLMGFDEIKVKRIVVYGASEYYKKFVYVEAFPERSSGVYGKIDVNHIEQWRKEYGEYHEEYAVFDGYNITREEYDDGAAVINGKVIDLKGKAELRIRYLTPYNFIICAQFNPINRTEYDDVMIKLLNGILEGENSPEDIVQFVAKLPRHRNDM